MVDPAEPNLTTDQQSDKDRKLKYWGLCLIGGGVAVELLGFIGSYGSFERFVSLTLMVGGILSCMIGIALYGTAKGNKWGWIVFACAIAIVPLIGPFVAIGYINTPRKLGLTLGICVFVVLILAIAIPNFTQMEPRARQSEARVNLSGIYGAGGDIYAAEKAYYQKHQRYGTFDEIGFTLASKPHRYTYRIDVSGKPGTVIPASSGQVTPDNTVVSAGISLDSQHFTATATGNIDADPTIDQWHVNDAKCCDYPDVNDATN